MRITLALDSTDPARLAAFWAAALGYTSLGSPGVFWPLVSADEREPIITINQVDDPKIGKNRMHIDLHVADLASAIASRRSTPSA